MLRPNIPITSINGPLNVIFTMAHKARPNYVKYKKHLKRSDPKRLEIKGKEHQANGNNKRASGHNNQAKWSASQNALNMIKDTFFIAKAIIKTKLITVND